VLIIKYSCLLHLLKVVQPGEEEREERLVQALLGETEIDDEERLIEERRMKRKLLLKSLEAEKKSEGYDESRRKRHRSESKVRKVYFMALN